MGYWISDDVTGTLNRGNLTGIINDYKFLTHDNWGWKDPAEDPPEFDGNYYEYATNEDECIMEK